MNDHVNCGGKCSLQCHVKIHFTNERGCVGEAKSKFEAFFFQFQILHYLFVYMEFKAPAFCSAPSMPFADTAVLILIIFWWLLLTYVSKCHVLLRYWYEFIWSMTLGISPIYLLNVANNTYWASSSVLHSSKKMVSLLENIKHFSSYLYQLLLLNQLVNKCKQMYGC